MFSLESGGVKLSFSQAKSALKVYPFLHQIRDFRNRTENPEKYLCDEKPIILRFPQELVQEYLLRARLPFEKIENARQYTSVGGQLLLYDRIDYGGKDDKTTLFIPRSHNDILPYESNLEINVPPFVDLWENYWKEEIKPESFTTLLHVDPKGMFVTKAYLDQRLTEALQSTAILPSQIKTGREAAMLQMLQELNIQAPRILGFNSDKTAFAMSYYRSASPRLDVNQ